MENHNFVVGKLTISMAIFNSYVKLLDGNICMISVSCDLDLPKKNIAEVYKLISIVDY